MCCFSSLVINLISVRVATVSLPRLFIQLLTFSSLFRMFNSPEILFSCRRANEEGKTGGRNKCCGINGAKNCFYRMPHGSHFLQTQIRERDWADPSVCVCVFVCVRVCTCLFGWLGESRGGCLWGGGRNKWDYWCYMSNIIAEIWAKRGRG